MNDQLKQELDRIVTSQEFLDAFQVQLGTPEYDEAVRQYSQQWEGGPEPYSKPKPKKFSSSMDASQLERLYCAVSGVRCR